MSQTPVTGWLLLFPQIPPQPSSLRVRVWRRLQQIGAVAVKNAAYALPDTEAALEDLTWLRQEIVDAGGGALLLRAQGIGSGDDEIIQLFRAEREQDYRKLAEEVSAFTGALRHNKQLKPEVLPGAERSLRQFSARLEEIRALDFFGAESGPRVEAALREARLAVDQRRGAPPASAAIAPSTPQLRPGQLWVTRAGVYVDRLACAWMLKRFVDPEARFAFVAPETETPSEGIPFDIAGAELGHRGARCSAEVVAEQFRPEDQALRAVAEVVHDLDLKDEGFGRAEAPGLKRLLDGISALTTDDQERIRAAMPLFDALYAGFQEGAE